MDSSDLFRRFESAMQQAESLRERRSATHAKTRRLVAESERIGIDIRLVCAATFQRRQIARKSGLRLRQHVDAHLAAVSLVKKRLQAGGEPIDLDDYLHEVCDALPEPDYQNPRIRHEIDCPPIALDAGRTVRLGLITSELVMNAHDHGFFLERAGSIRVTARGKGPSLATFSVSDTGSGFPSNRLRPRGPGILMVEALAGLMGAAVTYREGPHAAVQLNFERNA